MIEGAELERLFSAVRLGGYESGEQHEANVALIGGITHKICVLELILRNKIDGILKARLGGEWIRREAVKIKVIKKGEEWPLKIEGELADDSHDKLVSQQSLGFWVRVVQAFRIYDAIFDDKFVDSVNFRRYFKGNTTKIGGNAFRRHHKVMLLLILFKNLRNRSFHWENLFKTVANGLPRLSASLTDGGKKAVVGLKTDKIKLFLDDLIGYFNKDFINYGIK